MHRPLPGGSRNEHEKSDGMEFPAAMLSSKGLSMSMRYYCFNMKIEKGGIFNDMQLGSIDGQA
jgi:hypothetical protein